jgi:hypothetical protein
MVRRKQVGELPVAGRSVPHQMAIPACHRDAPARPRRPDPHDEQEAALRASLQ